VLPPFEIQYIGRYTNITYFAYSTYSALYIYVYILFQRRAVISWWISIHRLRIGRYTNITYFTLHYIYILFQSRAVISWWISIGLIPCCPLRVLLENPNLQEREARVGKGERMGGRKGVRGKGDKFDHVRKGKTFRQFQTLILVIKHSQEPNSK
jgi:hypothetical protein